VSETGRSAARANVRTIAPGVSFLGTLVTACIDGSLGIAFPTGARDYSAATIYVPTRRAARALAHAFAEKLQPHAVLLPRIIPLGDPSDLEERAILSGEGLRDDDSVPPAISDLERRLLLTAMIERWRESRDMAALAAAGDDFSIGGGFADSFALAGDLAGLIDEFAIEGVDWSRIKNLAPGQFDQYWALTREFLEIAGGAWPAILKERGQLDPAERQNRLLKAEAERLKRDQPEHPVIAAGSTGTVPATADLLASIARLPNGCVVLPGLDMAMDARGWALVADGPRPGEAQPGHPQAALKRLLQRLQIKRESIVEIGAPVEALARRTALVQASARAAEATDDWPQMRRESADAFTDGLAAVGVIEAPDERLEALAIAVALREMLESDGKTAALVTPDRALAQRVSLELGRWNIAADDSAGTPLAASPLGAFARLAAQAVSADFASVAVMELLSHPCLALGSTEAVATLELAGLRGHDLGAGLPGLAAALDEAQDRIAHPHAPLPLRRLRPDAVEAARALLAAFVEALRALADAVEGARPLSEWAGLHAQALEALAGERASTGADAVALGRVFDELRSSNAKPVLAFPDYAALFDMLVAEAVIAPAQPVQGRIKIWGLLEARLMAADRIVLGGLNESTWPPEARTDAFLNRAMRAELGLSSPERRIGQSAHDFAQGLGAPEVIIVRALSVEGTPMVASRFLRRLDAFVGEAEAKAMRRRGRTYLDLAMALDEAERMPMAERPNPKPDVALQPLSLSLTEIGTLVRDPYAIYARHVLRLQPLEPLETGVDARDRGQIIHQALAAFIKGTQAAWPEDPLAELRRLGQEGFAPYAHIESVSAFWWPVFEKVAAWFVDWEQGRRSGVAASALEVSGAMTIPLADGATFRLRGRADRIDQMADGGLTILDYKTGNPPSAKQVKPGYEPQLTLTAAMAARGGFADVPSGGVSGVSYVKVSSNPEEKVISFGEEDILAAAQRHIEGLKMSLDRLRRGEDGFLSRRAPQWVRDGGEYDHLARVKEWMAEQSD
jgi:ATP-dependent helicase/nuclease subunit B